jgi:hypothetical protein
VVSLCPPLSTACEEACENNKRIAMDMKKASPATIFSYEENGIT